MIVECCRNATCARWSTRGATAEEPVEDDPDAPVAAPDAAEPEPDVAELPDDDPCPLALAEPAAACPDAFELAAPPTAWNEVSELTVWVWLEPDVIISPTPTATSGTSKATTAIAIPGLNRRGLCSCSAGSVMCPLSSPRSAHRCKR